MMTSYPPLHAVPCSLGLKNGLNTFDIVNFNSEGDAIAMVKAFNKLKGTNFVWGVTKGLKGGVRAFDKLKSFARIARNLCDELEDLSCYPGGMGAYPIRLYDNPSDVSSCGH